MTSKHLRFRSGFGKGKALARA